MRRLFALLLALLLSGQAAQAASIAFGSSLHQWNKQPVWDGILSLHPELFIFAGDNVYTDMGPFIFLPQPYRIGKAYEQLSEDTGFARLRARVPILATWDDHDYGRNGGGEEYRHKAASKQYFMDFFDIPASAPMRSRPGIYAAHDVDIDAVRVQVLLLDTRTFRSPLYLVPANARCARTHAAPDSDETVTMLGDAQWAWLQRQLQKPAQVRLLVSSIQVIPEQHCFEKWANFPNERQRLLDALQQADGRVIIISGDRHFGEISGYDDGNGPMIHEITASGLNTAGAGFGEANRHRLLPKKVRVNHFGVIDLQPTAEGLAVSLQLRDVTGGVLQHIDLPR